MPSYITRPPSTTALAGRMPMIDLMETLLPEPDSPTMATVSPRLRSKLTPRTARTMPP